MDARGNLEQQFNVLLSTLREIQTGLLDSTSKVAGFLLLVMGWIATSDSARKFLLSDPAARHLAMGSLWGAVLVYAGGAVKFFRVSQKTLAALKRLDFMPAESFQNRAVDVPVLLLFVLGIFVLAGLTSAFLLHAK